MSQLFGKRSQGLPTRFELHLVLVGKYAPRLIFPALLKVRNRTYPGIGSYGKKQTMAALKAGKEFKIMIFVNVSQFDFLASPSTGCTMKIS